MSDSDSSASHDSTDSNIKLLEIFFGKVDLKPKVQRIYDKSKTIGFTKN
jgi:hypothetical protein